MFDGWVGFPAGEKPGRTGQGGGAFSLWFALWHAVQRWRARAGWPVSVSKFVLSEIPLPETLREEDLSSILQLRLGVGRAGQ